VLPPTSRSSPAIRLTTWAPCMGAFVISLLMYPHYGQA
jgi:hypothetical protein